MAGYGDETVQFPDRGNADVSGPRPRTVDAGRLWSGGLATAVVAALIGLVGVLVARALFRVAFAGSRDAGIMGDYNTVLLCVLAAAAALAATGLAHLLVVSTPRPLAYLGWIVGLVTVAATVLPFLSGRDLPVMITHAVIHLVIGLALGSLVTGAAASAMRSAQQRQRYRGTGPADESWGGR